MANSERTLTLIGGPPWGFRISGGMDRDYPPHISQVISQSRADKEGMQVGDIVLALNGKNVEEQNQNDVQRLLKKASGSLRILVRRNSSPGLLSNDGRPTSSLDDENEPILKQPKMGQQQLYRRKRAESVELDSGQNGETAVSAKKPPLAMFSARSVTNSNENLTMPNTATKPPLPWASSMNRQWAPLHFSPLSTSFNENYTTKYNENASLLLNGDSPLKSRIRSAPVTPMSPLSPVYNGSSSEISAYSSKDNLLPSEPRLQLFIETSGVQLSPTSTLSLTPRKDQLLDSKQQENETRLTENVTPNLTSISMGASSLSESFQRNGPSNNNTIAGHKLTKTDHHLLHSSILAEETSNDCKNDLNDKLGRPNLRPQSPDGPPPPPWSRDEYSYPRPESTCSDHPSLATGSLFGVDFTESIGSTAADSEYGGSAIIGRSIMENSFGVDEEHVGKTSASDSPSSQGPFYVTSRKYVGRNRPPMPVIVDVSSPSNSADQQAVAESVSEQMSGEAAGKDLSNSAVLTDSVSFDDSQTSSAFKQELPGDLNLTLDEDKTRAAEELNSHRYPLAFLSPVSASSVGTNVEEVEARLAKDDHTVAARAAGQEPIEQPLNERIIPLEDPSDSARPLTLTDEAMYSVLGPSFKAASAQPAVWTPSSGGRPNSSFNASDSSWTNARIPDTSSSLLSPPLTSRPFSLSGYSPVTFIPPDSYGSTNGTSSSVRPFNDLLGSPISAPQAPPVQQQPQPLKSPTISSPAAANGPSAPPLPPPPPPPAPESNFRAQQHRNQLTAEEAAIAADPNRSVVEYPEKQSVASLRSAIESKLNGSAPVKGSYPSSQNSIGETKPAAPPLAPVAKQQQPVSVNSNNDVIDFAADPFGGVAKQQQPTTTTTVSEAPKKHVDIAHKVDLVNSAVESLKSAVFGAQHQQPQTLHIDLDSDISITSVGGSHHKTVENFNVTNNVSSLTTSPTEDNFYTMPRSNVAASTPSQYWSTRNATTPADRQLPPPPAPSDLKSPTPPQIPPSPVYVGRPDNFARPYDQSGFRSDAYVIRSERTPPKGSILVDRKSTLENDQVHTDSYYSIPYRETLTAKRQIKQSDLKYDGVGPTDDRGTPLGLKQHVGEKEYQHQWYKMMYKKLHQIDKKEDESVLRYQMRDYLSDRYANKSQATRDRNEEENNPYTVTYKFADYFPDTDMDYEPGYLPQPASYSSTTLPNRNARKGDKDFPPRSVRSKSAGRYETAVSPPPSDIIRSSTPGERYKHQPKRIEDYVPGTSSIAEYEQEKTMEENNNTSTFGFKHSQTTSDLDSTNALKNRVISELMGKQRNIAATAVGRPQSSLAYTSTSRIFGAVDEEPFYRNRRDLSPPNRDEARQWYRNVQAGGEVPFAGLRQPAPERRDSWLRTALLTALKHKIHNNSNNSSKLNDVVVETRESSVQTNSNGCWSWSENNGTGTPKDRIGVGGSTTAKSKSSHSTPTNRSGNKLLRYNAYWKQAFKDTAVHPVVAQQRYTSPLYVETNGSARSTQKRNDNDDDGDDDENEEMRPSKSSNSFFSPVRRPNLDQGSTRRYAYERMRTKDFHLPDYRSPSSVGPIDNCHGSGRSIDYEIEAYFDYLKLFCEEENQRLLSEKAVQFDGSSFYGSGFGGGGGGGSTRTTAAAFVSPHRQQPWARQYEKSVRRRKRDKLTFDQTYTALEAAINEIDQLASGMTRRTGRSDHRSDHRRRRSVCNNVGGSLIRCYSLPNPLTDDCDNYKKISQLSPEHSYGKSTASAVLPFSVANVQKVTGVDWLPTVYFASSTPVPKNAIKRVHSLPEISTEKNYNSFYKQSKSMDSFQSSKLRNRIQIHDDNKYSTNSETDELLSVESDVMEVSFDDEGRVKLLSSNAAWAKRPVMGLPSTMGYRPLTAASPWSGAGSSDIFVNSRPMEYAYRFAAPYPKNNITVSRSVSSPNILRHEFKFSAPSPVYQQHVKDKIYRPSNIGVLDCMLDFQRFAPANNNYGSLCGSRKLSACEMLGIKYPYFGSSSSTLSKFRSVTNSPVFFTESPNRLELAARYKALSMRNYDKTPYEIEELAKLEKELIVEEERRKKYEREIEDQRSRRHGYIPLQVKTPILGDHRFEKLITDYSNRVPVPAPPSHISEPPTYTEFRGVARALYSFNAHAPRELSFFKGDLIKIRRIIDENWYEGEIKGRVGIIPSNYVEMVATADGEERVAVTEVSRNAEGQAQAVFNFDGRKINELPLRKNEYITLTRKIDDNWFEGKNEMGRRGIFPANYVRILSEPSSNLKDFVSAFSPPQATSTPLKSSEFRLQVNGVQYDPKEKSHFDKSLSMPPPSSFKSLDAKAQELDYVIQKQQQHLNRSGQAETYQTLYAYKPQNPDELELKEGDIVYVVEKCDDGWYIGTSLRSGKFGTFPGNYVKALL